MNNSPETDTATNSGCHTGIFTDFDLVLTLYPPSKTIVRVRYLQPGIDMPGAGR